MIELDAWNIRERDDWGQSAQKRAGGQEPQRWHWAYGGTCFRLDQRVESDGGRAHILSRGTVMTRSGVEGLREQLFAEAQRHGLAQADKVLVIADGALWIWNLTGDRFAQAHQRLDYYHASQHLWAVAHALHPEDEAAARTWIKPLLKKLKQGRARPAVKRPAYAGQTAASEETTSRAIRTVVSGKPPGADGLRSRTACRRTARQRRDGINLSAISMPLQTSRPILELASAMKD